jgi:PAS domain S-box-containing protein
MMKKSVNFHRPYIFGSFPNWLMVTLVTVIILLISVGIWFYYSQIIDLKKQAYESLETIAALKTDQVTQWRKERLDDGALLMESPFLAAALSRWLESEKAVSTEDVRTRLYSLTNNYDLADVILCDRNGRKRLVLSGDMGPDHESVREAMEQSFRKRAPLLTDLHFTPGKNDPHIDVVIPLFTKKKNTAIRAGHLILQYDARHFLFPLIQSWPVPSRTAETLLVRRDGDSVLFLNDLRHQKNTALSLHRPLTQSTLPAVMAAMGRQGIVKGRDYRGMEVLAVLKSIPQSPWFLVAKVDTVEALSPMRSQSLLILALLLGLIVAVAALGGVFWQTAEKVRYRSLAEAEAARRQSEEKYLVTLMSVGDGVIVTGSDGRVQLLNPVSEALTGWTTAEAAGKLLEDVFVLINEKTRESAENPASRVIQENKVIDLSNHTALISRDGREIPIEDSAAPIRDSEGKSVGVILVFHDVTEKRKAEMALRKAHDELEIRVRKRTADLARQAELIDLAHDAIIVRDMNDCITFWNSGAHEMYGWTASEAIGTIIHQLLDTTLPESLDTMRERILSEGRWEGEVSHARKDGSRITVLSRRALRKAQGSSPAAILEINVDITDRKNAELALIDAHRQLELQITELSTTHEELLKETEERKKIENQLLQSQKLETVGTLAAGIAHDFNNILLSVIGFSEMARDMSPEGSTIRFRIEKALAAGMRGRELVRRVLTFSRRADSDKRPLSLNAITMETVNLLRSALPPYIDIRVKENDSPDVVLADAIQMEQVIMNLCTNAVHALEGKEGGVISIEITPIAFTNGDPAPHSSLAPGQYLVLSVSDNGIGMAPDIMGRVFDPFFTTKSSGQGTGLGLSVVHGIVANHGGAITVSSQHGIGTTFSVYLPSYN